jgi:hypothetical protein
MGIEEGCNLLGTFTLRIICTIIYVVYISVRLSRFQWHFLPPSTMTQTGRGSTIFICYRWHSAKWRWTTYSYWHGLSTDLTIEKVLVMSVKSSGGLTRGRGIGKAQRTQWLLSMGSRADYYNAMQELTGDGYRTSDQHSDDMLARKERDTKRLARISWVHIWQKYFWSLTPTLAIFQLYRGVNKLPYIRYRSTIDVSIFIQNEKSSESDGISPFNFYLQYFFSIELVYRMNVNISKFYFM